MAISISEPHAVMMELERNDDLHGFITDRSDEGRNQVLCIWNLVQALPNLDVLTVVLTLGDERHGYLHILQRHETHFASAHLPNPFLAVDDAIKGTTPVYDPDHDRFFYVVFNRQSKAVVLCIVFTPRTTIVTAYPWSKGQTKMMKLYDALNVNINARPDSLQQPPNPSARDLRKAAKAREVMSKTSIGPKHQQGTVYLVSFAYRTCLFIKETENDGYYGCDADDEELVPISQELRQSFLMHNKNHEHHVQSGSLDPLTDAENDLEELRLAHKLRKETKRPVYISYGGEDVLVNSKTLRELQTDVMEQLFRSVPIMESDEVPEVVEFDSSPRKLR